MTNGAQVLLYERRGSVAVLTFNRPDKLNAINSMMLEELERRLDEADRDAGVRVLVLTGAGEKAFVAGADISEYRQADHDEFVGYQRMTRRVFSRLDRFPKPAMAAVNGYALGGGFEIALCCDVIVASRTAAFGLPEGLLGLSPGGGGTQRLARAVGPFVAADVMLSARRLSAEEAFGLGLVVALAEPKDLMDSVMAKAESMSKVAPLAHREMLELVRVAMEEPLEEGLTMEHGALVRLHLTSDAAEGIRAFVEKREPRFTGE